VVIAAPAKPANEPDDRDHGEDIGGYASREGRMRPGYLHKSILHM